MLFSIASMCFIISTGVTFAKNKAADNRLRRLGNNITGDNRSSLEIASSFVKDYFFLLVPGLNIIKAGKLFLVNDVEYSNKRLSKLREYERISDKPIVKNENKSIPDLPARKEAVKSKINSAAAGIKNAINIPNLPKKNNVASKPSLPDRKNTVSSCTNDIIETIEKCNDANYVAIIKKTYREKSLELRDKYKQLEKFPNTENERRNLVRRIRVYDAIFESARDRLVDIASKSKSR